MRRIFLMTAYADSCVIFFLSRHLRRSRLLLAIVGVSTLGVDIGNDPIAPLAPIAGIVGADHVVALNPPPVVETLFAHASHHESSCLRRSFSHVYLGGSKGIRTPNLKLAELLLSR